ncbi:hypothetical protein JCM3766R1_004824 [Sporobolomyces carnicolor]
MAAFDQLAAVMQRFADHPAFANLRPRNTSTIRSAPTMSLCANNLSLRNDLEALSCSEQTILKLEDIMQQAFVLWRQEAERTLAATAEELNGIFSEREGLELEEHLQLVAKVIERDFGRRTLSLRQKILAEVLEARSRRSPCIQTLDHPLPSPPPEPVGIFTVEVVSILQKAFETSETLSRAEVKGLMQVTGLNNKQFANARQHRGRKAAPYEAPRHPARRRPQAGPVRTVSDSSSSSFSSLETCASTSNVQVPVRLEPELSPVDPTTHQAQLWSSEGEDSSMDLSSNEEALPLFTSSLSLPVCMVTVPQSDPIPRAPTTAETDQFFASQQTLPPSRPDQTSPSRSTHWFQREWDPVESTESELSSMLDQVPSTHSFLDDQFFKNVFGTLGVTQGGGLILTMDSFSDDEFASQDPTGGAMNFGPTIGGGGTETAGMSFGW